MVPLRWQAAGSEVECWQWTELVGWTTGAPDVHHYSPAVQTDSPFTPVQTSLKRLGAEDRLVSCLKGFQLIKVRGIDDICRTQIHNEEEECWISAPQLSDKYCKKTFSSLKCRRVHQRLLNTGTMMGHTIQSLPQQNELYDTSINKKTRKLVIMSTTHECHNDLSSSTVLNTCVPAMHSLCNA